MSDIRIGYILVPSALAALSDAGPACKRAKVERRSVPQHHARTVETDRAVYVSSMTDLTELKDALGHFAQQKDSVVGSVTVEVQYVTSDNTNGDGSSAPSMVAFSFVPGALDAVLAQPTLNQARVQSAVHALSAPLRRRLGALPFPRAVRVANAEGGEDECAVVSQVVLRDAEADARREQTMLSSPILVVGAGGIGCELLKVLVLRGFVNLHLADLDTIDATNLNRQFLFTTSDVGHSKAETACAAVLRWFAKRPDESVAGRPTPVLVPHHDNIKSAVYDTAFYSQFSAVLNALDNVSARQHVNRLCVRAKVPLIESGTMGYNGQVQPILPGLCECYDCRPKPADQQTFAVCTIHARPTTMVHCVHYAKELYTTLFAAATAGTVDGEPLDEEEAAVGTTAAAGGGGELQYLIDVVRRWRDEVHTSAQDPSGASSAKTLNALIGFGEQLVECLYVDKVKELLAMKSSWSTTPPVPLEASAIHAVTRQSPFTSLADAQVLAARLTQSPHTPTTTDDVRLFVAAAALCADRTFRGESTPFRKEDDTAVQFVAAAANLRAHVFHIEEQPVESLRTIAGAIVPAIATTNAMAAAGVVQQLEHILAGPSQASTEMKMSEGVRMIYIRKTPQTRRRRVPLTSCFTAVGGGVGSGTACASRFVKDQFLVHAAPPCLPAEDCKVCQRLVPTVTVTLNLQQHTLGELATDILENLVGLESVSITHASSIIYEEDFESLGGRLLGSFLPRAVSAANEHPATASSLWLVVDALNREMEWELELRHTDRPDAGVSVAGVDDAKQVEARVLRARATQAARAREEAQQRATADAQLADGAGATAAEALLLESGSDDDVQEPGTPNRAERTVAGVASGSDVIELD